MRERKDLIIALQCQLKLKETFIFKLHEALKIRLQTHSFHSFMQLSDSVLALLGGGGKDSRKIRKKFNFPFNKFSHRLHL